MYPLWSVAKKQRFFYKKTYKGTVNVKMDIYKCPNPKKFKIYNFEKERLYLSKLLLTKMENNLKNPYAIWSQKLAKNIGEVL